jgi:predicted phosphodiesterase
MRIAVISDIHGNCIALDAVLADLDSDSFDEMVCLGDAIQGGPQPAEVVARLRELACPVVMGNADAWLLTGEETGNEPITEERLKEIGEIRKWSLTKLSEEDKSFIAKFQPTVEIPLNSNRSLLCFHGSPTSFDLIILPTTSDEDFNGFLASYLPNILTGGHTHMQQIRRIGASDSFFFNPGSVGFGYSHNQPEGTFRANPWAEYAVLSVNKGRIALEFRQVPFDVNKLIEVYKASGRPYTGEAVEQYGGA